MIVRFLPDDVVRIAPRALAETGWRSVDGEGVVAAYARPAGLGAGWLVRVSVDVDDPDEPGGVGVRSVLVLEDDLEFTGHIAGEGYQSWLWRRGEEKLDDLSVLLRGSSLGREAAEAIAESITDEMASTLDGADLRWRVRRAHDREEYTIEIDAMSAEISAVEATLRLTASWDVTFASLADDGWAWQLEWDRGGRPLDRGPHPAIDWAFLAAGPWGCDRVREAGFAAGRAVDSLPTGLGFGAGKVTGKHEYDEVADPAEVMSALEEAARRADVAATGLREHGRGIIEWELSDLSPTRSSLIALINTIALWPTTWSNVECRAGQASVEWHRSEGPWPAAVPFHDAVTRCKLTAF